MNDLVKRIMEIGKPIFRFIAPIAGWTNADMKAGIFDIDIENALKSMSQQDLEAVRSEVEAYRTYTALYVRYGYKKIEARNRKDALALAQSNKSGISWNDTSCCLKAVRSRYIHEFRIASSDSNLVRIEYLYDGTSMSQGEKKSFVKSLPFIEAGVSYTVHYFFVKDSFITEESTFSVMK